MKEAIVSYKIDDGEDIVKKFGGKVQQIITAILSELLNVELLPGDVVEVEFEELD